MDKCVIIMVVDQTKIYYHRVFNDCWEAQVWAIKTIEGIPWSLELITLC